MSNVVRLAARRRELAPQDQVAALAACFAQARRGPEDVLWLKENAEFLNVLESSWPAAGDAALDAYGAFFAALEERFTFFPQYYRFLLAICLDLEDLGMPGTLGERLIDRAIAQDLAGAELSDLQRAEAARLFRRRGRGLADDGMNDRLRRFAAQSATFALPNKKACYELTHIAFYLSEYGRRSPDLPDEARTSLHHAGLMAWLDGNVDLLAEVCVSLMFAGWDVPEEWTREVTRFRAAHHVAPDPAGFRTDGYHAYLMSHWHGFLTGATGFAGRLGAECLAFRPAILPPPALREVSQALFLHDGARVEDWHRMRRALEPAISSDSLRRMDEAARHEAFDGFFARFVRAAPDTPIRAVR